MNGKVLMVLGTSSSAGKSLLVTALCHYFARRGVRVAPFKAQNMSNNAAVCADGSEIGRAQANQALAAGVMPSVEMNPILIKPEANSHAQVIVMGRPWKKMSAREFYTNKEFLWGQVITGLDALRAQYDLVIAEGAGSPVELNLKDGDIVNMAIARYANAPVILVGDIDRGGIFAQLLGTLWLLDPEERGLLKGFVINKFRGDLQLFHEGVKMIAERGRVPVLGVVPYLQALYLPEEDAVSLENPESGKEPAGQVEIDIAVIRLPRIANFDDFDPLANEPGVRVRFVDAPDQLGRPHAVIIPGTKSTVEDLRWLRELGFAESIQGVVSRGGEVVGICGGYQMLGLHIQDPDHVESNQSVVTGLGLLPIETHFETGKATFQVEAVVHSDSGWMADLNGKVIFGYEIHMGRTSGVKSWLLITSRNGQPVQQLDGTLDEDNRVWGCYLHGLFANRVFRQTWLKSLGWQVKEIAGSDRLVNSFSRLADTLEASLDMRHLEKILWGN